MSETKEFDFKKNVRELLRSELRPSFYEQEFILSRPTTHIRERDGLLQELSGKRFTDEEADVLFDGYCNKIREANKLPLR